MERKTSFGATIVVVLTAAILCITQVLAQAAVDSQEADALVSAMAKMPIIAIIIGAAILVLLTWVKQVNEYERAVILMCGQYSRTQSPGWFLLMPVFQTAIVVDIRTKSCDVPPQDAITKDNISLQINAVIFFKVNTTKDDAGKRNGVRLAALSVEDYESATALSAQTTIRDIVGQYALDDLLKQRDAIANRISTQVDKDTDPWGVKVERIEIKDIILDEDLKGSMAEVAEAEREKQAMIIRSQGEVEAARNIAEAAKILSGTPGALELKTLQTIGEAAECEGNNTIWVLPSTLTDLVSRFGNKQ